MIYHIKTQLKVTIGVNVFYKTLINVQKNSTVTLLSISFLAICEQWMKFIKAYVSVGVISVSLGIQKLTTVDIE